jgi:hypothetical protein
LEPGKGRRIVALPGNRNFILAVVVAQVLTQIGVLCHDLIQINGRSAKADIL